MVFLAKVGIGFMGAVLVGGAAISSEGLIRIRVQEKSADGRTISLLVPGAIAPLALRFVPRQHLAKASADLRPELPVLDAAIPALEECPDGVLVEVVDPEEHVIIAKAGGSIVVEVNDPNETVHVVVPLRAALSSLHELAAAGGPI
jgi:hypothetical protein